MQVAHLYLEGIIGHHHEIYSVYITIMGGYRYITKSLALSILLFTSTDTKLFAVIDNGLKNITRRSNHSIRN